MLSKLIQVLLHLRAQLHDRTFSTNPHKNLAGSVSSDEVLKTLQRYIDTMQKIFSSTWIHFKLEIKYIP